MAGKRTRRITSSGCISGSAQVPTSTERLPLRINSLTSAVSLLQIMSVPVRSTSWLIVWQNFEKKGYFGFGCPSRHNSILSKFVRHVPGKVQTLLAFPVQTVQATHMRCFHSTMSAFS